MHTYNIYMSYDVQILITAKHSRKKSFVILQIFSLTAKVFPCMVATHQLQLKQDTSGPHKLHTHVFVIYTVTRTVNYLHVYRATHVFTTSLHAIYIHTRVLAVIHVITSCTSINSPQLDQVTHAAAYQCFDHKHGQLFIVSIYIRSND